MKGKLIVFFFGVIFTSVAQILAYYFNPASQMTLKSFVHNPWNFALLFIALFILIMAWMLVKNEDRNEKIHQTAKETYRDIRLVQSFKYVLDENNMKLAEMFKKAFKEALKEDREEQQSKLGEAQK